MEQVQLSTDQIKVLFDYIEKKNMKYKDLQYELVDHLATSIEKEMEADQTVTFDHAFSIVRSRFPITGFYKFVAGKESALKRFWMRKFATFLLSFFKIPKIILTILVIFSLHQFLLSEMAQQYNYGRDIIFYSFIVLLIGAVFNRIKDLRNLRNKYLIVKSFYSIYSFVAFFSTMTWLIFLDIITITPELPIYWSLLRVTIFCFYLLALFSMIFVFPNFLFEEIRENYKEYEILEVGN